MQEADIRRTNLSQLLRRKRCLRVLEAHSPISALLAEQSRLERGSGPSLVLSLIHI